MLGYLQKKPFFDFILNEFIYIEYLKEYRLPSPNVRIYKFPLIWISKSVHNLKESCILKNILRAVPPHIMSPEGCLLSNI